MKPKRWVPVTLSLFAGCATPGAVGLKPDGSPGPEPCPRKALETMAILRLHPGLSEWIELDQSYVGQDTMTVNDGPIESILQDQLGDSVLVTGTRLYGKVWTSGPNVVVRYYEAHPPDPGEALAICAIARLDDGELKKKPGPAPGSALLEYTTARLMIVDAFR
jgi:hypothetical protein